MSSLKTKSQIAEYFDSNSGPATQEQINRIRAVQIAGARHGKAGYYPDGQWAEDADWCNGVGAEINALEAQLEIDDDSVLELYTDAHGAFFRDGTINPSDRYTYMRNSVFTFHFGAYGYTKVSVWEAADHVEDALEKAAEWLAKHAPGLFSEPDYAAAAKELGIAVPFVGVADITALYAADEDALAEAIQNRAEVDHTRTESGWLLSWEWSVRESDVPPGV